ncbi:type III-B CRISPR module RAMP protein Cmr6 [Caenibacillus caldisaponilyticus]|uniref:type III-B CRISPR module RAMP protein Cmr6 n=1 Tax=Caenibacillus caldisaponilyticus TaxID=1674942 RepID=UPI0009888E1F|nr:type III-B CRISPR module RAMP protein Cmr6 [Caenibacillus caldisaponilyticus]
MQLHPSDTREAFKRAKKDDIAHLWYHVHYNQMFRAKVNSKKTYNYKLKNLEFPIVLNRDLQKIAEHVESQRRRAFADLSRRYHVRLLKGKPIGRLIHGLGGSHVRETSLTLHPVYGIPYIPASSLKGTVRHWFIQAFCNGDESRLEQHQTGRLIFGTQSRRGVVQFHDIFLFNGLSLEPDILTVHFKEYYGKSNPNPATDDQAPNPVMFWTIQAASADIFLTAHKDECHSNGHSAEELIDLCAEWTKFALAEIGIGSKTAAGYGYFKEIEDVTSTEFLGYLRQLERDREEQILREKREQEKKLEEARRIEEEKRLANLPPEERLIAEIQRLTDHPEDREKSKTILFAEVKKQQNQKAAEALKVYWQKTGDWDVKKKQKKQYEKVQYIKDLLSK